MVRTSEDARDAWKAYAEDHGVSLAALLEALANQLPGRNGRLDLRAAVDEARAIDVEGRRRG